MSALTYCDPFKNARSFHGALNRLFDQDFEPSGQLSQWPMRVDIKEDKERIVVTADVPGMEQKDITVNVDNGMLTISGERKFNDEENQEQYHRVERAYGRFSRSFQLSNTTDTTNISATYTNGVLEVTLPKREEAKPRSIKVKIN